MTPEVAGSSPVAPAEDFNRLAEGSDPRFNFVRPVLREDGEVAGVGGRVGHPKSNIQCDRSCLADRLVKSRGARIAR